MLYFRRATEDDVPEIVSFTMDTWEWGDYIPRVIGRWVAERRAYVAVWSGRITAVAAMLLIGKSAYLQGLRVRPELRGRGIGEAMTRFLLDEAKRGGASVATLLVAEWNAPSHKLVQKVGFKLRMYIYGGRPLGNSGGRCLSGVEAYEAVAEALGKSRGYACLPDEPWVCTALTPWDLLSRGTPCVDESLYIGRFSFGKARGDPGVDVTSLTPDGYKERYATHFLYAIEL
ncbi:GNAT family N-acetyltransferase [Pyrobaculum aerophilum]|uniref:GNAT family N-acetyltransferase n=1 Tax=Pyrobaculum aerophilum TaxID=13773 RepID=A0A371QXS2_9CREN|nr:GNAT family N-acetyltransferase [Pyrobaculum aerophilum]RFA95333.1 GNAT family N-acetyltransferase [Pyrobaculum aerophilum]RFA98176.1 GNAT family N-acetyltransferase [Pyrobaculum aerophilum]